MVQSELHRDMQITYCKEFEDDSEFYWDVIGSSKRNIPLLEARDENGNVVTASSGMIGAGTAPFYLVFGEDWSKWAVLFRNI